MATSRSVRRGQLPPGFASIQDIIDGRYHAGSKVHVAGIVTDFRAPIATRGSDWKCEMRLYDQSVHDDPDATLCFSIFRPRSDMPDARCGDVIVVLAAKVQIYQSSYQVFTHKATDIYVFDAARIPKPFADASVAQRPPPCIPNFRSLGQAECEFVSVLYASVSKDRLPMASEFEVAKSQSKNVKNKFSELKDVQDGQFVDTVVQIVREPFDLGDKITLWVSDYTENPLFYHHQLMGGKGKQTNPYGYATTSTAPASKSEWNGPLGKLSMQITCFEPHASVIREEKLTQGAWVSLRNLHVKYGHSMANLEGFLRENRGARGLKINISQEMAHDPQHTRFEVKNALRRKLQYEKTRKMQIRELEEAAIAGAKRRAEVCLDVERTSKMDSKTRRRKSRAQRTQAQKEQEGRSVEAQSQDKVPGNVPLDLNMHIKCENGSKPSTLIADVLAPVHHEAMMNGKTTRLFLPFINANYRTFVRVVDFMPARLEDFARPKRVSVEYSALSDHGDSDSDPDAGSESDGTNTIVKQWEWRFCLRLEEANAPEDEKCSKKSLWAVVDNQSAQMLLNLDASDLRHDDANLGRLRQKMFILWGDLEEYKAQLENQAMQARRPSDGLGRGPPADSDDEAKAPAKQQGPVAHMKNALSNRSFGCCIRQYGVRVDAGDVGKDGGPVGWQRMFGLFGTKISMV
ncbi:hypothetical protein E4U42_003717 [Claviceps africana]|uniref:Protection of telomeres protein 1 n=1 Tax=Claviceps africana TaxID=83212 RepID=A0A8K0NIS5_9HYPO|nr:hypothetical protein E4U42_003717 [Claviceps africana]